MRVGLIAPPWLPVPPVAYGGIEAMVDTLARGLSAAGHEVVLAASSASTCPVAQVPSMPAGVAMRVGNCIDELQHTIVAHAALTDVDIIHDHTLCGPLYRYRANVPLVATAHGPFRDGMGQIYRAIARETALIAISAHQRRTAPAGTIRAVIHHGLDTAAIPVGQGQGGYVCFLGRMSPDKGVVEAIKVARAAGVPLLIGAKMAQREEFEYFKAVVEPQLGPGAQYLGELNAAQKYELLGSAIALLNPIRWPEPFGMVMIESLATGTPVVATPCGSAPELIDHGCTGIIAADLDGLAHALTDAASLDRGWCRHQAEARFSADRMVAEHIGLYTELIG